MDELGRCPICGQGTLADLTFDLASEGEIQQQPDSRQLETYTCGHRAAGPRLETADAERLEVERRSSDETVDPPDPA